MEKVERKIARFGRTGKGNAPKLMRELNKLIDLMIENSFDYDEYYEEMDGYDALVSAVEAYN